MPKKQGGPLYRFFQKHGWCQNTLRIGDKHCLVGAVMNVSKKEDIYGIMVYGMSMVPIGRRLKKRIPKEFDGNPSAFNDQPGMTKRKIMAFLRRHNL